MVRVLVVDDHEIVLRASCSRIFTTGNTIPQRLLT